MATTVRFRSVRKKLDQLGYRQTLGSESLSLVEKLVSELEYLQGRSTLSPRKSKANKIAKTSFDTSFSTHLDTFSCQIKQLTQENNHLHQTIIKQTEAFEATIHELKSKARKLENENYDLRFLNNQYVHKIRTLEQESHEKSEKICQLQDQKSEAIIQVCGQDNFNGRNPAFRRQRMEIGRSLSSNETLQSPTTYVHVDDPYIANMLEVADKRISQLQNELCEINSCFNELQNMFQNAQQQLTVREHEIERLNKQISRNQELTNRVDELISKSAVEKDLRRYNLKIEKLEEEKQNLELQLSHVIKEKEIADEKLIQLTSRNNILEQELLELKNMTDRIQFDKEKLIRTTAVELGNSAENETLRLEKEKLEEIIHARDTEILQLQNEKHAFNENFTQITNIKKQLEDEVATLRKALNRASGESKCFKKPYFTKFGDNVTEIQRKYGQHDKLNEFNRFATDIYPQPPVVREHAPVARSRHKVNQSVAKQKTPALAFGRRAITPPPRLQHVKGKDSHDPKSRLSSPVEEKERLHKLSRNVVSEPIDKVSRNKIKTLEGERDYYRQCYEMQRARDDRITSPPTRDSMFFKEVALEDKVHELTKELEDLKKFANHLEAQNTELQRVLKDTKTERDLLQKQFRETEQERRRLEQEFSLGKTAVERSVNRRLERENEQVCQDLQTLTLERDAMRDKLKLATEMQIQERRRLENEISQLQTKLIEREKECNSNCVHLNSYKGILEKLEENLRSRENELAEAKDQITQHVKCSNQLKKHLELVQTRLDEANHQLHLKETSGVEDYVKELEKKLTDMNVKNRDQAATIENLRRNITALDCEKDQIQSEVDLRTEKLASVEDTLQHKDRIINDLKITLQTMEVNMDRQRDEISGRDKEIRMLRHQLELAEKELQTQCYTQNNALEQIRTMQEDLGVMTRENQRLHADLDLANEDKQKLKLQIQNYVAEVTRVEELFREKDQERLELLEQFQNVTMEANSLESQNNHLEAETATIRVELHAKNIEVQHLQTVLGSLQQEIEQYIEAQHTMELELSQMKRTIRALDEEHENCKIERDNLQSDYHTVTSLCTKLENDKEDLTSKLALKEIDCEKFEKELEDIRNELDGIRGEARGERVKAMDLENLLSDNRRKEFQTHMSYKDVSSELRIVQDQLADCEKRLLQANRDALHYRAKTAELETELEKVQRQMTNERFEKERVIQELRKVQSDSRTIRYHTFNSGNISNDSELADRLRSGRETVTSSTSQRPKLHDWADDHSRDVHQLSKKSDFELSSSHSSGQHYSWEGGSNARVTSSSLTRSHLTNLETNSPMENEKLNTNSVLSHSRDNVHFDSTNDDSSTLRSSQTKIRDSFTK